MKHIQLTLILLILFVLEGSLMKWIIPAVWQEQVIVATNFTLIVVLFMSLYVHRHLALVYGLAFGLLHDVVYYSDSTMIGTYSFAMGLVGYLTGLVSFRSRGNIVLSILMIGLGTMLFEIIQYGLYRLFQVTGVTPEWAFFHIMLPSVLIDLLFALLIYVPMRKWLEEMPVKGRKAE